MLLAGLLERVRGLKKRPRGCEEDVSVEEEDIYPVDRIPQSAAESGTEAGDETGKLVVGKWKELPRASEAFKGSSDCTRSGPRDWRRGK